MSAATEASARLTIEVVVVPTVQNRVAVLLNSGTVTSGSGVMFNFAPDNSQATTSTIEVRTVPTETLDSDKEMSAPDSPDQSILQTLTVIAR
jgi:hypothetical protein